jgi:hypothetical protein
MVEPLRPAPTKLRGRDNWVLIPTVADINAITAAEWAAGFDITRVIFRSSGKPAQTTNRVTAEARYGDTRLGEFIGESNVTGGDILYAFADQAAAGSDGKKLYEEIPEGTTAVLANRRGVGRAVDAATGQFYNAYGVEFGPSFPADAGEGESAESAMSATFAIPDPDQVAINKAIVAA